MDHLMHMEELMARIQDRYEAFSDTWVPLLMFKGDPCILDL